MVLEALAAEVAALEVPADGATVAELLRIHDRLSAVVASAVGAFGASEGWALDGAVSLRSWLRHRGGLARGDAGRLARTATRLHAAPVTAAAWRAGELSGGHVQAVVANVSDTTAGLFADHEPDIVPALAAVDPLDAPAVMSAWRLRAEAVTADDTAVDGPVRQLFHSRTLEGRSVLQGGFDPEGAEVIDTALRLVIDNDNADDGGRVRLPGERRADALVDVCRHFLDHQQARRGGRHRPHLNVIVDLDAVRSSGGQGRLLDGTALDPVTTRRLLCDAGIHRMITDAKSTVVDYGRTTRTISPAMWATLVVRDRHCRAPGCDRPPEMCEAHHVVAWQAGGATSQHNLVLLCTRHHHVFHQPGWKLELTPGARLKVTDPRGRHHSTDPPPGWVTPTPGQSSAATTPERRTGTPTRPRRPATRGPNSSPRPRSRPATRSPVPAH